MDFDLVLLHRHIISILVFDEPSHQPSALSFIHCPADWDSKAGFWEDLSRLGDRFAGPGAIVGDFNMVLDPCDKQGGKIVASSSTNGLYQLQLHHGLVDLGFSGASFTWCNGKKGSRRIKEQLDKAYANPAWASLFPKSQLIHLPRSSSDHCPILLQSQGQLSLSPKLFHFEQFWSSEPSSVDVIQSSWSFPPVVPLPFRLYINCIQLRLLYENGTGELWVFCHMLSVSFTYG